MCLADMSNAVCDVARPDRDPSREHWNAARQMKYVQYTRLKGFPSLRTTTGSHMVYAGGDYTREEETLRY